MKCWCRCWFYWASGGPSCTSARALGSRVCFQQHIKVKSLENAEKNPRAIESWIESISELHRCKPPATVHYSR